MLFFNNNNHGYRAAISKKNSLWLLPICMVVATSFSYEKVRWRMRTAIVSNLLNPSGFYSTFVGANLEYPNLLRFDRGSWSELRYSNFESSLKLWWRSAGDFDGSQILGFFKEVFKFWNFKTSSLFVLHHFHPYIRSELLENYCKSLLVY